MHLLAGKGRLFAVVGGHLPGAAGVRNGLSAVYRSADGGGTWERQWAHREGKKPRNLLGTAVLTADGRLALRSESAGDFVSADAARTFTRVSDRREGSWVGWSRAGYVTSGDHDLYVSADGTRWDEYAPAEEVVTGGWPSTLSAGDGRGRGMDQELAALTARIRQELKEPAARARYERMTALARQGTTTACDELARVLQLPGEPLWARELAAFALGTAGDRRAFETLVLLLNYRDPARAESAASALARLRDPRTARAAAALATNPLRTAYALHAVRLLARLRAPESVPALISTLERLLRGPDHWWPIARACVEGLGELADPRAVSALTAARVQPQLREPAAEALARVWREAPEPPAS